MTVELYEDDAGHLYLRRTRDGRTYAGLETTDSCFTADARALHEDQDAEWSVPLADDVDGTLLVATWSPTMGPLLAKHPAYSSGDVPLAGDAAQRYVDHGGNARALYRRGPRSDGSPFVPAGSLCDLCGAFTPRP